MMIRRKMLILKYFVSRKKGVLTKVLFMVTLAAVAGGWLLSEATSKALLPPTVVQELGHFRRNRSLGYYMDSIQLLIEPSGTECDKTNVSILALVTTTALRFEQREAIRNTWGEHLPTYFFMGLNGLTMSDLLVDIYVEAKMYSDMVVYDFADHYQNLTLKTALMLKWTLDRCPRAQFMFKTDDDVLVNPWTMKKVLAARKDAALVGYKKKNSYIHRDEQNKWYLPRWLHHQDYVSEYLSGTGYLINGTFIGKILDAAYAVPLVNLEDIYFTHLVARMKLNLTLTHDARLSPYKPWLPFACLYWSLASAHSLASQEMITVWPTLQSLGATVDNGRKVCGYYPRLLSGDMFLF